MSDIFISYASADRERAKLLSEALDRRGWSVWWDRTIPPGKEYDEVIEKALDSAKCVVVLWSNASIASSWVKTEAAEAMRRKILVPAMIDHVTIPLEFRRLQAADLSHWRGDLSHPELKKFFDSIGAKIYDMGEAGTVQKPPMPPPLQPPPPVQPGLWKRAAWPAIALIGALVGVASGLMLSRSQQADTPGPAGPVPVVAPQPPQQPTPTPTPPAPAPAATVDPGVVDGAPNRPPGARNPNVVKPKPAGPAPVAVGPAPVAVEPKRPALPESPAPPVASAEIPPVAATSPTVAVQEFEEILLVVTNGGEIEELDAILVFDETSLVVKDEDSNILHTLPYSSVRKATYSRTQRRIVFVRTTRHQLTLGAGGEEVVLRLPDATYQTILYQFGKRGVTVAQ